MGKDTNYSSSAGNKGATQLKAFFTMVGVKTKQYNIVAPEYNKVNELVRHKTIGP